MKKKNSEKKSDNSSLVILIFEILKIRNIGRSGGGQHLERLNVELSIFWNFIMSNIKITKDESFDFFYLFNLYEQSKYMVIYQIGNFCNFDSFPNCKILKISYVSELNNSRNLMIF